MFLTRLLTVAVALPAFAGDWKLAPNRAVRGTFLKPFFTTTSWGGGVAMLMVHTLSAAISCTWLKCAIRWGSPVIMLVSSRISMARRRG